MTIYIVSYTSYEELDRYLYAWRKVFINKDEAFMCFADSIDSAIENITNEGEIPTSEINIERDVSKYVLERNSEYFKIAIEITEHEI